MDPWEIMDAWCEAKSQELRNAAEAMLESSAFDTDAPEYRVVLGQSQAMGRMRSFIHGARNGDAK
jgi:hypothetical protein